ncbi:MAG: hypothetical protein HY347_03990 [candidate division NC10 bacterium]|nr:hypothetical protein [candidate division NC10 bacterium]
MSIAVFEDFVEAADLLTTEGYSGDAGASNRVDGAGGVVEIETGTGGTGRWRQHRSNQKMFEAKLGPAVAAFLRTKDTTNQEVFVGLADAEAGSANNMIGFYRSDVGGPGNWKCRTKNASGNNGDVDSLFAGDLQEVELAFAVSLLEVAFVVNGRVVHVEKNCIPTAQM